jgi:glycosyltransferase involved in cell wall biosynthesis
VIIAHVGTVLGGAGTGTLKIHRAVRSAGVTSRFFAADPRGASPDDAVIPFPRVIRSRNSPGGLLYRLALKAYTMHRPPGAGLFSYTSLPMDTPFPFDIVRPDVIHLHWIAQGIDYGTFFNSIPSSLPVVWTLNDMEPFSGGCHYAGGCLRYQHACGRCPQLNALRNPFDLSAITFARKRASYARLNLSVVAVGNANVLEARQSPLLAHVRGFHVIPIGIDTSAFAPRDRSASRAKLGLPDDRIVLAFGAVEPGSVYKGLPVLLDAIGRLRHRDRVLLQFFGGVLPADISLPDGSWRHAGFEHDPRRLSEIYSAADVLVLPSLSEALGQVGLEALACGTPVVGSRVGGIPDYVIHETTGLLSTAGDAGELAANLDWIIEHPEARHQFGAAGPPLVRERFSLDAMRRSYVALYERLTAC